MQRNGTLLNAALGYADLATRCSPAPRSARRRSPNTATSTPPSTRSRSTIGGAQHPTANVAIAAEGLVVIDIDGADNLWLHDDPDRYQQLAIGPMVHACRAAAGIMFFANRLERLALHRRAMSTPGRYACRRGLYRGQRPGHG